MVEIEVAFEIGAQPWPWGRPRTALPCLAATGRRWHANNTSVGYVDWTSFYLFHLHPPCSLLSRVKLDECKTSRSTYTEQIHTYPKLIHVLPGDLYSERAGNHSTNHWQTLSNEVFLRFVPSFLFHLPKAQQNEFYLLDERLHRYSNLV